MGNLKLYIKVEGKEYGPFDAEEIKALVRENRFGPDDFIRREFETSWFRAANIASLRAMFEPTPTSIRLKCLACSTPLEPDAVFCEECGQRTPAVSKAPLHPGVICPHCKAVIEIEDAFCGECGVKLAAQPRADTEIITSLAPPPETISTSSSPFPDVAIASESFPVIPQTTESPQPQAEAIPKTPSPQETTPLYASEEIASPKKRGLIFALVIVGGLAFLVLLVMIAFSIIDYLHINPFIQEEDTARTTPVIVEVDRGSGVKTTTTLVNAAGGGRSPTATASKLAYYDDNVCGILEAEGPGELTLDLTVMPNGAIMKASVINSTYGSVVNTKVENAARNWDFGVGKGPAKLKVVCRTIANF